MVDMGHILGINSHVSTAICARSLLAMAMETWDPECGPFRPNFAAFAILCSVVNTISPWGKGSSQEERWIPVASDQGSIARDVHICSSRLAGGLQLMVRVTLPNFAFLAIPRGTACSQRDSKPKPDARDQWGYQIP